MKILRPNHQYELENFEKKDQQGQIIQFIEKESFGTDALMTINDGTTNEEVLRMMIDRMNGLQAKFPCRENEIVITKLQEALMWLEERTKGRVVRGVEGMHKA